MLSLGVVRLRSSLDDAGVKMFSSLNSKGLIKFNSAKFIKSWLNIFESGLMEKKGFVVSSSSPSISCLIGVDGRQIFLELVGSTPFDKCCDSTLIRFTTTGLEFFLFVVGVVVDEDGDGVGVTRLFPLRSPFARFVCFNILLFGVSIGHHKQPATTTRKTKHRKKSVACSFPESICE